MRNVLPLVVLLACHRDDTDTSISTGDGLFAALVGRICDYDL